MVSVSTAPRSPVHACSGLSPWVASSSCCTEASSSCNSIKSHVHPFGLPVVLSSMIGVHIFVVKLLKSLLMLCKQFAA